jgi:transposase InsO family protein
VAWLRLWASRDFTASAPNVKYVGDITYLPLATGTNLYLATVIDCCSRRVAGWAIAQHMRTELVADALKSRRRSARHSGRCNISFRSRKSVHLRGFCETRQRTGRHSIHGWPRVERR